MKTFYLFLLATLFFVIGAAANAQESMNMVAYFPTPYSQYSTIQTNQVNIGVSKNASKISAGEFLISTLAVEKDLDAKNAVAMNSADITVGSTSVGGEINVSADTRLKRALESAQSVKGGSSFFLNSILMGGQTLPYGKAVDESVFKMEWRDIKYQNASGGTVQNRFLVLGLTPINNCTNTYDIYHSQSWRQRKVAPISDGWHIYDNCDENNTDKYVCKEGEVRTCNDVYENGFDSMAGTRVTAVAEYGDCDKIRQIYVEKNMEYFNIPNMNNPIPLTRVVPAVSQPTVSYGMSCTPGYDYESRVEYVPGTGVALSEGVKQCASFGICPPTNYQDINGAFEYTHLERVEMPASQSYKMFDKGACDTDFYDTTTYGCDATSGTVVFNHVFNHQTGKSYKMQKVTCCGKDDTLKYEYPANNIILVSVTDVKSMGLGIVEFVLEASPMYNYGDFGPRHFTVAISGQYYDKNNAIKSYSASEQGIIISKWSTDKYIDGKWHIKVFSGAIWDVANQKDLGGRLKNVTWNASIREYRNGDFQYKNGSGMTGSKEF